MLKPFLDRHVTLKTLSHHPTKILFELLQAQGCVKFEIVKDNSKGEDGEGPMKSCCSGMCCLRSVLDVCWVETDDFDSQWSYTTWCWRVHATPRPRSQRGKLQKVRWMHSRATRVL